jgi:hypothetical protein
MTFDSGLLCSAVFYVAKVIDVKENLCFQYTKSTHTLIKKTDNIIDGNN